MTKKVKAPPPAKKLTDKDVLAQLPSHLQSVFKIVQQIQWFVKLQPEDKKKIVLAFQVGIFIVLHTG